MLGLLWTLRICLLGLFLPILSMGWEESYWELNLAWPNLDAESNSAAKNGPGNTNTPSAFPCSFTSPPSSATRQDFPISDGVFQLSLDRTAHQLESSNDVLHWEIDAYFGQFETGASVMQTNWVHIDKWKLELETASALPGFWCSNSNGSEIDAVREIRKLLLPLTLPQGQRKSDMQGVNATLGLRLQMRTKSNNGNEIVDEMVQCSYIRFMSKTSSLLPCSGPRSRPSDTSNPAQKIEPYDTATTEPDSSEKSPVDDHHIIAIGFGAGIACVAIMVGAVCLLFRRRKGQRGDQTLLPTEECPGEERCEEIQAVTRVVGIRGTGQIKLVNIGERRVSGGSDDEEADCRVDTQRLEVQP